MPLTHSAPDCWRLQDSQIAMIHPNYFIWNLGPIDLSNQELVTGRPKNVRRRSQELLGAGDDTRDYAYRQ